MYVQKDEKEFVISLFCFFNISTLFYLKTFKALLVNQIELGNKISLLAFGNVVGAYYTGAYLGPLNYGC